MIRLMEALLEPLLRSPKLNLYLDQLQHVAADEAARRARWALPAETVDRLARVRGRSFITEGLAPYLAQALHVPENRVRKAAGLPLVPDDRANITTRPHLWLVKKEEPDDATG